MPTGQSWLVNTTQTGWYQGCQLSGCAKRGKAERVTSVWYFLTKFFWHFLTFHFGPFSTFDFGQINVIQKLNLKKLAAGHFEKPGFYHLLLFLLSCPISFFQEKKTKTKVKIHKWIINWGDILWRAWWNNWRLTPSNPGGPRRVLSERSRRIKNRDSKSSYG